MQYFTHKRIETRGSWIVGTQWQFRNAVVEMHDDGFTCTCKKKLASKCSHIKSVEMGLFGVGTQQYKVA